MIMIVDDDYDSDDGYNGDDDDVSAMIVWLIL